MFSHRLQNETKHIMQQTNDALQELNNTRVVTEADLVKFEFEFNLIDFVDFLET